MGETLKDRVGKLLEEHGLNPFEAARRGGLERSFVNDIMIGRKTSVRGANLAKLAKGLGTTAQFLLTGGNDGDTPVARAEDPPTLPEFDIRAGASYGGGQDDHAWESSESDVGGHRPVARWGMPQGFVERELGVSFGFADIIQIRGDSMEDGTARALASGDRVIIDRKDTDPRQGGIFAVFDGEGVIVKQIEMVRGATPPRIVCKSRNSNFDTFELTLEEPVRIIGRVAGKISRL